MNFKWIFLFFMFVAPLLAIADKDDQIKKEYGMAISELMSAKSIECAFPLGTFARFKEKSMILQEDHFPGQCHFDNIDVKDKHQARVIGNAGASDAHVFLSASGLTFVEITEAGNYIYTTIYPSYIGNNKINAEPKDTSLFPKAYVAVTSRHLYSPFTGPMSSQYQGYCRILE